MNYQDSWVKCPFYREHQSEDVIVCEGVESRMNIEHTFAYRSKEKRKQKRDEYLNKYCCDDYKECRIYRTLMQKYDDG